MPYANATFVRYLVATVVAFAISAVCVTAGFWQFHRHEARAAAIARFETHSALDDVALASLADTSPEQVEWRAVTVHGAFVPGSTTVLRNRSVAGTRADQVLAWFAADDGRALLVNAGWTEIGRGEDAALPSGIGTIRVMLRQAEPDDGKRAESASRITSAQMPPANAPIEDVYGVLLADCDAADCLRPALPAVPAPRLSLGPHFAYAIQWWLFALLAPIGALALARRDPAPIGKSPGGRSPRRRAASRQRSDEEIEDAL